jgi:hypothetical protein
LATLGIRDFDHVRDAPTIIRLPTGDGCGVDWFVAANRVSVSIELPPALSALL